MKTCPMFALAAAVLCSAAAAAPAPTAKAVVWNAIHAHKTLGPCVLKTTYVLQNWDSGKNVVTGTIRWNDSTHYAAQFSAAGGGGSLYVNGSEQVLTSKAKKVWIKLDPADPELQRVREIVNGLLPNALTGELTKIVQDPMIERALTKYPLTTTKINGVPAYRLYARFGTMGDGSAAFIAVAFGKADSLVRKAMRRDEDNNIMQFTADYKRQAHRFPASDFKFKPPAGYTEVGSVEDILGSAEQ